MKNSTQTLQILRESIASKSQELARHFVYGRLTNLSALQTFMKFHVYAVWDFMSLLKALQREITCVEIPWRPSKYSKGMVRLINEIVLGEESDLDHNEKASDHFSLYLEAMKEAGLDVSEVLYRIQELDFSNLDPAIQNFVQFNLDLACHGSAHQVCAAFFFGREKIIPDLFRPALEEAQRNLGGQIAFNFYLARHIELDGDEHGPLAENCLREIVGNDDKKWREAYETGLTSLYLREKLWDAALLAIDNS